MRPDASQKSSWVILPLEILRLWQTSKNWMQYLV